ncbi:MAG: rSAM-modified peptide [Candidatus Aminicenantes bacterium]|nr:rSAM-modified peptide [Candidatus Aminicenantes bacterium]NIM77767.1 rSAM-modified peptide [Candidatus Aminicenantes bacterium]NIN17080.1 rSAM-modified peptide [Candidatus Aminicenantes bacterium]NIN40973.1 rSAM-modified peptide [Candidatus Aminicenantes bacterium]NIN83778.1 rSAM-modified peptide [Candidatus Aminicenantes bacterium]
MKTKPTRKFTLNKETVANLNNRELAKVYGGTNCTDVSFCITDCKTCWQETLVTDEPECSASQCDPTNETCTACSCAC